MCVCVCGYTTVVSVFAYIYQTLLPLVGRDTRSFHLTRVLSWLFFFH